MSHSVRKRPFWYVRPPKTFEISLLMRESLLFAWRKFASLAIQNAHSEDSDQPARMRRLIWIFAERTCVKGTYSDVAAHIIWSQGIFPYPLTDMNNQKISLCFSRHYRLVISSAFESSRQKTYRQTIAPSDDSDQDAHSRSLIRIFTERILYSQGCTVSSCGQWRLWSAWWLRRLILAFIGRTFK